MRTIAIGFSVGCLLAAPVCAQAATFIVNSTVDTVDATPGNGVCSDYMGTCTLRAAVQETNSLQGEDTINVPAGVYGISLYGSGEDLAATGDLDVTDALTIIGAGPKSTIIDGNHIDNVIHEVSDNVTLKSISIRNALGYGVYAVEEDASVHDCYIYDNSAGGIAFNFQGDVSDSIVSYNGVGIGQGEHLKLTRSRVYNNAGYGVANEDTIIVDSAIYANGGYGLYVSNADRVMVARSDIHDNLSSGIVVGDEPHFRLIDSYVHANHAAGPGGGVWAGYCGTEIVIQGSTLSDNDALDGGGLYLDHGCSGDSVEIANSTISGNRASGFGGGVYINDSLVLSNVTISDNVATDGGAVYIDGANGAQVSARDSIIAGNLVGGGEQECGGTGDFFSFGYNLIKAQGSCSISGSATDDIYGADAMLDALADNGGPSPTHALLAGSAALDGGDPAGCKDFAGAPIVVDQRGARRPQGARCDIGAFESGCGDGVNDPGGGCDVGGQIRLRQLESGTSIGSAAVATARSPLNVPNDLYMAVVTYRRTSSTSNITVSSVSGMGLTWIPVVTQCSGRSTSGISLWMAQGNENIAFNGVGVTATLTTTASAAALVVSRYSGVDPASPIGNVVSANTGGVSGPCAGGADGASYAMSVPLGSANGMAWGATTMRTKTHSPGGGFTERIDLRTGTDSSAASAATEDKTIVGMPVALTVNGSFSGVVDWAAVGVELRADPRDACSTNADCNDDVNCTVDTCNQSTAKCDRLPNSALCSDGLFCNGNEICDPFLGCRFASFSCSDGVNCTTDSCNESTDSCNHVPNNSACSDGFFCDGIEICNASAGCQDASDPCAAGQTCNESSDQCEGGGGGSPVVFKEVKSGTSTSSASVSTATQLTGVAGDLYLAAVAYRRSSSTSNVTVSGVSGLGLTWTPVTTQCSGRSNTGISVWKAQGTPSGNGGVTASLTTTANAAAIAVSRYSGASPTNPLGSVVSANTIGAGGACTGGTDSASYAMSLPVSSVNGLAWGVATMRGKTHTPGAGFTERVEVLAGSSGSEASAATEDKGIVSAPTTLLVNGTFNGATDWAAVALEVRAGGGGGGCSTNADCNDNVSCTVDTCNQSTHVCSNATNDALCSNGLFCDGAETCSATLGCRPGTPVSCSDGVSCTTDTCNESTDSCAHAPNNGACSNSLFCDGVEVCNATAGCQDGPDPCGAGQTCDETNDVCQGGATPVTFKEVKSGISTSSSTVATATQLSGVTGDLYLAAVSYRRSSSSSNVTVSGVSGLGLTWAPVVTQCSARSQTGISVWKAQGTPSGSGAVTASLTGVAAAAAIAVSRYSGVNATSPLGSVVSANTLGAGGACAGGTDSASYAMNVPVNRVNGIAWGAASMRGKTHTPGAGFTERIEVLAGAPGSEASAATEDETIVSAPATVTVNGTFSGATDWAAVALELR